MHKKKTEEMEADHQEFTRLIRENQAILYDFIKCRILDKSLAQDVLQETLYIAYKKWDQLKEHPNQTGFLIETARYKIQDFNKKTRKLQREIPIEGHEHIEAKDQYGKVDWISYWRITWTKKIRNVFHGILYEGLKYRKWQSWKIRPRTT